MRRRLLGARRTAVASSGAALGVNLPWIATWSGDNLFANLMYQGSPWVPVDPATAGTYSQNQGELTCSNPNAIFRMWLSDEGKGLPAGTYTVYNPDGCTIALGAFGSHPTPDLSYKGWTNETLFTFNWSGPLGIFLYCKGGITRNSGNLRIIQPGMLASWNSGCVWNPSFIAYCRGLGAKVLRFMDMLSVNTSFEEVWADRTKADRITLKNPFIEGNAAVPHEFVCDLANRVGKDPWVNIPSRAGADYVAGMAAVYNGLGAGRKAWFELANEVWNFSGPFREHTMEHAFWRDQPRQVAVANQNGTFTKVGHGMTTGQAIYCWTSKQNLAAYEEVGFLNITTLERTQMKPEWSAGGGFDNIVEVIDANTFKIHYSNISSPAAAVGTRQVNLLYTLTPDNKLGNLLYPFIWPNHAKQSLDLWDVIDPIMGIGRVVHLMPGQATFNSLNQDKLAVPNVISRMDYFSTAPYFYGAYFGVRYDVASGSITPNFFSNVASDPFNGRNVTLYWGVYPLGATPSKKDIKNGTGAIAHQTSAYNTNTPSYDPVPAFSGLTNGVGYKVVLLYESSDIPASYVLSTTVTPSVGGQPVYAEDTYANTTERNMLDFSHQLKYLSDLLAMTGGKPMAMYEGSVHYYENFGPIPRLGTWVNNYKKSAEYAECMRRNMAMLASFNGFALWHHYGDVLDHQVGQDAYADLSDVRYQVLATTKSIPHHALPYGVISTRAPNIISAPGVLPYVVHTFADATLNYKLLGGDDAGNYRIDGNVVKMIGTAGLSFNPPNLQKLSILISNDKQHFVTTLLFNLGDAWYESDASFAWRPDHSVSPASIIPDVGGGLPNMNGTLAIADGDMWQVNGAQYESTTAFPPLEVVNGPILFAATLDKFNQSAGFRRLVQLATSTPLTFAEGNADLEGWLYITPTPADNLTDKIDWLPSGKAVYWALLDVNNNQITWGRNQRVRKVTALQPGRTARISELYIHPEQFKVGSIEVVQRPSFPLSEAKAIVATLQGIHSIALLEPIVVSNIALPAIYTAPGAFPVLLHTFADADYTYSITAGNGAGHFAIVGNQLRMVNASGIDFSSPTTFDLTVSVSNGGASTTMHVTQETGVDWFEIDAAFAFNSLRDSTPAALTPEPGHGQPIVRTGATDAVVSGGLWTMTGTSGYSSGSAIDNGVLDLTGPVLFAAVLDRNGAPAFQAIISVGSGSASLSFSTPGSGTGLLARFFSNAPAPTVDQSITLTPGGLAVCWLYLDDANHVVTAGYNQTTVGSIDYLVSRGSSNVLRDITLGASSTAKVGSIQAVRRVGLTLAQAKAIVAKMQSVHGL